MVSEHSLILSIIGAVIEIYAAGGYLLSIVHGQSRPLRVTWAVWSLAGILGLWASLSGGGGIGLLVTATFVLTTTATFALSLFPKYGKPGGQPSDYVVGTVAAIAFIVWRVVHFSPDIAATIAVMADAAVLWLIVREAWIQPETETLWPWVGGAIAELLGALNLGNYSYAAAAYTIYILIGNVLIISVLLIRQPKTRHKMKSNK
jgi:hypothetical protein